MERDGGKWRQRQNGYKREPVGKRKCSGDQRKMRSRRLKRGRTKRAICDLQVSLFHFMYSCWHFLLYLPIKKEVCTGTGGISNQEACCRSAGGDKLEGRGEYSGCLWDWGLQWGVQTIPFLCPASTLSTQWK